MNQSGSDAADDLRKTLITRHNHERALRRRWGMVVAILAAVGVVLGLVYLL